MIVLYIILGLAALVGLYIVFTYNALVSLRVRMGEAWSDIEVQMKRRYNLIPNLVETVKGYMNHERDTLEAVVNARAAATQARIDVSGDPGNLEAMGRLAQSEGVLEGALGRLLAVAEAYPDLKANQNMAQLTEELTTTENKIAFARQNYNDQVNTYQAYKASFPQVVLANSFGFQDSAYLDLDDRAHKRENINVSFDDPFPGQQGGLRD